MQTQKLVTPLTLLIVTALVILIPMERSGWTISLNTGVVPFLAGFLTTVAIYSIFTLALNVQWGYTGVFNFGVAAFFMVGAYTGAIFAKGPPAEGSSLRYVGGFGEALSPPFLDSEQWLPFIIAALAAGAVSGLLALALSLPTLRLREDYLAITTIGIAELLRRIVIQEDGLVNGSRSLIGIPRPLSGYFSSGTERFVDLAVMAVLVLIVFLIVERGIRSPWGRVLRALKEDEVAVAASGKDVFSFKMQGFVIGAVIMGMGGAFFAFNRGAVGPSTFDHFFATFLIWAMLIVGGSGNNWGAIAGAYVVWGFWTTTLQINGYDLPDVLQSRIFFIRDFVVGALIVVVLLLRPQGLFPEERRVSSWLDNKMRRRPEPPGASGAPGEAAAETDA